MERYNKPISTIEITNSSDVAYGLALTKELLEKLKGKISSW